jgi:hypothetical protein
MKTNLKKQGKQELAKGDIQYLMQVFRSIRDFRELSVEGKMAIVDNSITLGDVDMRINQSFDKHLEALRTEEFISDTAKAAGLRAKEKESLTEEETIFLADYAMSEARINQEYTEVVTATLNETVLVEIKTISEADYRRILSAKGNEEITPFGFATLKKFVVES